MNYALIKPRDIADGPGIRVALFVSGCTHHCKGCFNAETWDFHYGQAFTDDTLQQILSFMNKPYICGLTFLGGEPFERDNQPTVLRIAETVKKQFPSKSIWCYSGYTYESDILQGVVHMEKTTDRFLQLIDVLVDGEFHIDEKDISLRFRGSKNQRLIDIQQSLRKGTTVLWDGEEML